MYVDLSYKNVKYTNNTHACTLMPARTQKDSAVHGRLSKGIRTRGGGSNENIYWLLPKYFILGQYYSRKCAQKGLKKL